MRKLILVLATTAVHVFPAFARKETGALEGTVGDQDGTPLRSCGCLIINRVGSFGRSVVTTWELRRDKMGHFFQQFPVGTYLVKVLGQGRILKEIADVHVEDGGVQNIDSVLGVVSLTLPPSGAKKPQQPKQTPPPTQPDVVRGCVAIRNIAFQRARPILLNSNLGVSGWIENRCGRDAYVTINASFFDAYGKQVDQESEDRLVGPNGAAFRIGPDQPGPGTVYAKDGKITDVWVKFQP